METWYWQHTILISATAQFINVSILQDSTSENTYHQLHTTNAKTTNQFYENSTSDNAFIGCILLHTISDTVLLWKMFKRDDPEDVHKPGGLTMLNKAPVAHSTRHQIIDQEKWKKRVWQKLILDNYKTSEIRPNG